MRGKLPILLSLIVLQLALAAGVARAFTDAAWTYAKLSADGKRLLVLTAGDPGRERPGREPFKLPGGRSVDLPGPFKESGVYDVASLAPLWLIDLYAYERNLVATPDLEDIAIVSDRSFENGKGWGLSFYHRGVPTRRYRCDELLKSLRSKLFFQLTNVNWHLDWYHVFEGDGDTLLFETAPRTLGLGERRWNLGMADAFRFDMRTGEILARRTIDPHRLALTIAVPLLIIVPAVYVMGKKHRARLRENVGA